jgi:transposase
MLENQIRGLAVVFGIRLPRALSPAFIAQALQASEGIDGLSAAMRGLVTARVAVLSAVTSIAADIKKLARASKACRRLMTIPGVGHLTALAFTAAVDDPERFRRSRDLGAYLGLVPRRINPARSITPAAFPNAATGECEPCFTKPRTLC